MSAALLGLVSAAATHGAATGYTANALAAEHFAIPGAAGGPQMALSLQSQHHLAHLTKISVFLVVRSEARARALRGSRRAILDLGGSPGGLPGGPLRCSLPPNGAQGLVDPVALASKEPRRRTF